MDDSQIAEILHLIKEGRANESTKNHHTNVWRYVKTKINVSSTQRLIVR